MVMNVADAMDNGRENRRQLIKKIEDMRHSKVICYVTGDRINLETRIAHDCHTLVFNHLRQIGKTEKIDLYLYTPGGITVAGWGLVNLIREFCDAFGVLVPYKAWSCGTLICLGAEEIVMGRLGQLGPIDPSTLNPFNPPIQGIQPAPQNTLPMNVEDIVSYIDLAKKEVGLKKDDALINALNNLSKMNPLAPLALGAAHRVRPQIVKLATGLLQLHMGKHNRKVNHIVDVLAKQLGSHDYLIGRKEAKSIGLKVVEAPNELETAMWGLYNEYESMMQLTTPYNPATFLNQRPTAIGTFIRAAIESPSLLHIFRTIRQVNQIMMSPPGVPTPSFGYQETNIDEGWILVP